MKTEFFNIVTEIPEEDTLKWLYVKEERCKLNLDDNFSGNYWCEGHRILSFDLKESNKILILAEEKHTYSLVLDIRDKCDQRNIKYFPSIEEAVFFNYDLNSLTNE